MSDKFVNEISCHTIFPIFCKFDQLSEWGHITKDLAKIKMSMHTWHGIVCKLIVNRSGVRIRGHVLKISLKIKRVLLKLTLQLLLIATTSAPGYIDFPISATSCRKITTAFKIIEESTLGILFSRPQKVHLYETWSTFMTKRFYWQLCERANSWVTKLWRGPLYSLCRLKEKGVKWIFDTNGKSKRKV